MTKSLRGNGAVYMYLLNSGLTTLTGGGSVSQYISEAMGDILSTRIPDSYRPPGSYSLRLRSTP